MSEEEIRFAQELIDDLSPGIYELSKIYGKYWDAVPRPTGFGVTFKRAVDDGLLMNIVANKKKTNNHWTYCVNK